MSYFADTTTYEIDQAIQSLVDAKDSMMDEIEPLAASSYIEKLIPSDKRKLDNLVEAVKLLELATTELRISHGKITQCLNKTE